MPRIGFFFSTATIFIKSIRGNIKLFCYIFYHHFWDILLFAGSTLVIQQTLIDLLCFIQKYLVYIIQVIQVNDKRNLTLTLKKAESINLPLLLKFYDTVIDFVTLTRPFESVAFIKILVPTFCFGIFTL